MRLFTVPCGALYMFYSVRNRNTALFNGFFLMEGNLTGGVSYKYVWHNLPLLLVIVLTVTACLVFFSIWRFREISVRTWILGFVLQRADHADHLYILHTEYFRTGPGRRYRSRPRIFQFHLQCISRKCIHRVHDQHLRSLRPFYKLPLKVLGGNFLDFMLITALIGGLCFLCSF